MKSLLEKNTRQATTEWSLINTQIMLKVMLLGSLLTVMICVMCHYDCS